jgi:hypothetical protein
VTFVLKRGCAEKENAKGKSTETKKCLVPTVDEDDTEGYQLILADKLE